MIIYKALNLTNGKVYIGQSKCTLDKRKTQHYKLANKKTSYVFHRALRKYDVSEWQWDVICEVSSEKELSELEIYFIDKFRSYVGFADCNGYNMTLGGEGGNTNGNHPNKKEIYEKIARRNKGEHHYLNKLSFDKKEEFLDRYHRGSANPMYNIPKTIAQLEAARKVGASQKGYKHTDESKQKMSIGGKGKITGEKNPNYRKTGSMSHCSRSLVIIFPDGKEMITHCITDFALEYNLQASNLRAVQRGKNTHHKGFKAREYNPEQDKNIEIWEK